MLRCVSPIPVALKKGSSPLQVLQGPSKGWEKKKLLCKELDLNLRWTRRPVKHLLTPKTFNHSQACCFFRSEQFDTSSSNYRKKNKNPPLLLCFVSGRQNLSVVVVREAEVSSLVETETAAGVLATPSSSREEKIVKGTTSQGCFISCSF